jgi:uncharacterized protein (UPF0332 family)
MKAQSESLLRKADRALRVARRLRNDGDLDFAAGRAYYAMFYTAEALLFERGLSFSKHAGVHAAFGEHLAKPGVLDPKFHRYLLDAFAVRLQADYGFDATPTADQVDSLIVQAEEFLHAAQDLLGRAT